MKKRLIVAFVLLLLFSTYKSQKLFSIEIFNIKEIEIENNSILSEKNIKKISIFYMTQIYFF
ncbi:hypothetical protein OAS59_00575 [Pelagibacteraceae bacterium]|nr:hypothetical protein [Pelagibacteraceae bacterium]